MVCYKLLIFTFIAVLSTLSCITAEQLVSQTLVVDPSGTGGFKTIQAAIDSVPSKNQKWIQINIKNGLYREKVTIPQDKPYIYLKGSETGETVIEWGDHGGIDSSATFASQAEHTIARGIKFVNSFNSPPNANRNPIAVAVAARIQGDKSAFYNCGFFSVQDTLFDDMTGRHYFKNCTIEGAVDFIFGAGQSIYESCTISVAGVALNGSPGYIAAQGRGNPKETSAFVFKNCNIVGTGKTYLGRPWREFARTVFYNTEMSDIVVPQGWDAWTSAGKETQLLLGEYNSRGAGAGARSSERVKWAKAFSQAEADQFASLSFIDEGGWVDQAIKIFTS